MAPAPIEPAPSRFDYLTMSGVLSPLAPGEVGLCGALVVRAW
jgi:hypothetical protein